MSEQTPEPAETDAETTGGVHHEHVRTDGETGVDDAIGSSDDPS